MLQSTFLDNLQKELPDGHSLNEAIATALDISYDAAHRRTSLKSKFSLEEGILLSKYFNLSLDKLFETTSENYISVEKTKMVVDEESLKDYFLASYNSLKGLVQQKDSSVIYSAKDLPLFYTIGDDILSRFKMYVWLKLLDSGFDTLSFEQYAPKTTTIEASKALQKLYSDLNIVEIWDITTINSTLKQINFYFQAGLMNSDSALKICGNLKSLVHSVSKKVKSNRDNYQLYYNELLLMNNNVLIKTSTQKSLFVPFTVLSYYQTQDKLTCTQAESFLNKQLQSSKLLNTAGEKEQRTFFNKIILKISALSQLIEASQTLDFE
ncbi:hypothetical protein [Winogradskyella sp. 3972H.M.0a.05]|uniref:hypothetical protein n=1 Tax=Winogradskyella sp. 3972H.M.0a.05 TaxID=2950277 RepID=UPI0033956019